MIIRHRKLFRLVVFVIAASHVSFIREVVVLAQSYNEVQYRVLEAMKNFLSPPVFALGVMDELYKLQGFPHGLEAPDRDRALRYMYSIIRAQNDTGVRVYYGMESGLFLGYTSSPNYDVVPALSYREPGESGYDPIHDLHMQQYWNICVNPETGEKETCRMEEGGKYISCVNNCQTLVRCPDADSQRNCSSLLGESRLECVKNIKWCKHYSVETLYGHRGSSRMGYIPRSFSCINPMGSFTRAPGDALLEVFHPHNRSVTVELGNCSYTSGAIVTRKITGPYAYCGGQTTATTTTTNADDDATTICTAYTGVYRTVDYDPRYRSWYQQVKVAQRPRWSHPYPFFATNEMGITYANPLFSTDPLGRNVFVGVLAADYSLTDISNYLVEAYQDTDIIVGIYEDAYPHSMIGLSTGSRISKTVLSNNHSQPCPQSSQRQQQDDDDDDDDDEANNNNIFGSNNDNNGNAVECEVIRISVTELQDKEGDLVIKNAHLALEETNVDMAQVISIKAFSDDIIHSVAYSASFLIYEQPGSNIQWRIIVLRRMQRDAENSITENEGLFPAVCSVSVVGFILCFALFIAFYKNRKQAAVKFADIQLTSAFVVGCAVLNLSSITFLGENTDKLCMLRMWVFYLCIAMALSPLFVKAYRTWLLLSGNGERRKQLNNFQAWLRTLPIPLLQGSMLLTFTYLDPPRSEEVVFLQRNSMSTQEINCEHESNAFIITQGVFHLLLIAGGCILSYKTRNLDSKISDSKALLFAMYNIAFTVLMISCIVAVIDISKKGRLAMQAIGVFCATVFSSMAFVIPRLMAASTENQDKVLSMTRARNCIDSKRIKERKYTLDGNFDIKKSDAEMSFVDDDDYDDYDDYDDDDDEFGEDISFDILLCTSNMGNAKPNPASMAAMIPLGGACYNIKPLPGKSFPLKRFDMIVVGMQESTWSSNKDKSPAGGKEASNIITTSAYFSHRASTRFSTTERSNIEEIKDEAHMNYLAAVEGEDTVAIQKMIKDLLGEHYMPIAEESRGEMRLYIYAANEVAPFVENIKVTGANTGVGNVLANKGGIIVSFNYMKTKLSFLSAHLAAHEGQNYYQTRCDNIYDILKSSNSDKFGLPYYDASISSHHMFVMGDLNFRTKFGDEEASHEDNVKRALQLIQEGDFDALYSFDELHKGIANGDLLVDFQTLPCDFHPTFKVQREPGFVYKEQRTPSYTDRILFKSASGVKTKLEAKAYEPCVNFTTSDHKPVRAAFSIVPNERIDPITVGGKLHLRFYDMSGSDLPAADLNGFSDPYLMVIWDGINIRRTTKNVFKSSLPGIFGKHSWPKTKYKTKTLNPVWAGEEISLLLDDHDVTADAMLYVVVMDWDFCSSDDWLGAITLDLMTLIPMVNFEKKKEISFDQPLVRYGKFSGRIKFKLDMSIH